MIKRVIFSCFLLIIEVTAIAGPRRIISLAPSITKMISLLDAEDLLVGCTSFCILDRQRNTEIVASAIQVNIEKIALLKPDLILVSDLTRPETVSTFRKLGIEVYRFTYAKTFDDLCTDLTVLGDKLDKKTLAENIIDQTKAELERVRGLVPERGQKPRVFAQIGTNPLWAVIPETFMNDFIEFAGSSNIVSDARSGAISREQVLVRNPEVIFIMLMGNLGAEEKDHWKKYSGLDAVKNGKIFLMDQERTCSPTPPVFVETLEEMIRCIYELNE